MRCGGLSSQRLISGTRGHAAGTVILLRPTWPGRHDTYAGAIGVPNRPLGTIDGG